MTTQTNTQFTTYLPDEWLSYYGFNHDPFTNDNTMAEPFIDMAPLDLAQTADYLAARLNAVDGDIDDIFDESDLESIHEWSEGIIGRINNVARQVLIEKMQAGSDAEIQPFWVQHQTKLVGGLMLALIIVFVLYFTAHHRVDQSRGGNTAQEYALQLDNTPNSTTPSPDIQNTTGLALKPETVKPVPAIKPHIESSPQLAHTAIRPKPIPEIKPEAKPQAPMQLAKHTPVQPTAKPHHKAAIAVPHHYPRALSIAAHTPSYTIQLLGVSRYDSLQHFLTSHKFPSPPQFHHTKRQGKDWYVLTLGRYPSRHAAEQSLHKLSPQLKALHPWVRKST